MDLLTQLVDHFVTLWFLLMHPPVGLMFAFFLLGTLLMLVYLHKLSNSAHIFLIILLRPIRSKDSFPRKIKSNKLLTPVEYNFDEIAPEEPITIQ